MNDLEYGQLSNPNRSLKLVLMHGENHRETFLQYFYYLGQGFYRISFLELIFLDTKGKRSHLYHSIIFDDFMSYQIYDVLEILWLEIHRL